MYLHVYACIWVVNDKITINTTAKLPQTAQQWTHHQQGHTGTLCSGKKNCCSFLNYLVVHWPNHGPGVDVKQGAPLARGALPVAHAPLIASILAAKHAPGDCACVTSWNQGQFPQDMRQQNHIQYWFWGLEIQKFSSYLGSVVTPIFGRSRSVIEHSLNQNTLALHHYCGVPQ